MACFLFWVSSALTCNTTCVTYSDGWKRQGEEIREVTQCLASRGPCVDPEAEDLTTWLSWHTTTGQVSMKRIDLSPFSHTGCSSVCLTLPPSPSLSLQGPLHTLLNCQGTHTFLRRRGKDKSFIWSNTQWLCENIYTLSFSVPLFIIIIISWAGILECDSKSDLENKTQWS